MRAQRRGRIRHSRRYVSRADSSQSPSEARTVQVSEPQINVLSDGWNSLKSGGGEADYEKVDVLVDERSEEGDFPRTERCWDFHASDPC